MTRHTKQKTTPQVALSRADQIQEILKCGSDPIYFISRYVKIVALGKGLIPFETFPFQNDCIRAYLEHRFVIVNKSRQLGLSTISAAYCLWLALFQKNKSILVIATDLQVAMNFLKKVKHMFQHLPRWLILPVVANESKQQLEFDNGSVIRAVPTSDQAGRSFSLDVLIVDECLLPTSYVLVRNRTTGEVCVATVEEVFSSTKFS